MKNRTWQLARRVRAASLLVILFSPAVQASIGPRQATLVVSTAHPVRSASDVVALLEQYEHDIRAALQSLGPSLWAETLEEVRLAVPLQDVEFLFRHADVQYRGWRPPGRRCWVRGQELLFVVDLPYIKQGTQWKTDHGRVVLGYCLPKVKHETHTESFVEIREGQPMRHTNSGGSYSEGYNRVGFDQLPRTFDADRVSIEGQGMSRDARYSLEI